MSNRSKKLAKTQSDKFLVAPGPTATVPRVVDSCPRFLLSLCLKHLSLLIIGGALGNVLSPASSAWAQTSPPSAPAPILDKQALLEQQTFWSNRDFDWYKNNIPFLDSPDAEINTTYYYRWELVTRHMTYGSPNTGYVFTEFSDRPFWSGAYGAIACPSGHQLYEVRWLHDARYARDYLKYWFRTPGAQPRKYSSWLADSAWAIHCVHPNQKFLLDLFPDLEVHFQEWKRRQWVEESGLFWQLGHDDGMEFDINARQTRDILRGGPSLRPSFNSYMWAEAQALARMAELASEPEKAAEYRVQADAIKEHLQQRLWDPQRSFFFPMSTRDEVDAEGNVVQKNSLTYQTGKFAGSPHGRELHGYVPWAFNLPDHGYEEAWRYLMDPNFFFTPFGPTTVELNDPQFLLKQSCCWWSGQSWPFATTQTLKAMANVIQNYPQTHVSREDYTTLLHHFALSHRKDEQPYIAEALHPHTGSWEGHDGYNHSEHYFHSGFTDLVITGLAGLQPSSGDTVVIDPLIPDHWDYFALDHIPYRGQELAIVWDRLGSRYGLGAGLHVLVNGRKQAHSDSLTRLEVSLPPAIETPLPSVQRYNYVVNNDGDYFPRLSASHVAQGSSLAQLANGQIRYDLQPPSRWTAVGAADRANWLAVDFGQAREIDTVKLYFVDIGEGLAAPESFRLEYFDGSNWLEIPNQQREPQRPAAGRPNVARFPALAVQKLRAVFQASETGQVGATEWEAWGESIDPFTPSPPPVGNLAFNRGDQEFPQARASFSDRFGGQPAQAIDGKIIFDATPMNRWTSYESPEKTDWLEIDLGQERPIGRVVVHLYDDGGGVQAPAAYQIQAWDDERWQDVRKPEYQPEQPTGDMANTVTFESVTTSKVRVLFTHKLPAKSGATEIEIWEK